MTMKAISVERTQALAKHYLSRVKGLYVGGSSGSLHLQNVEERKQVFRKCHEAVNLAR